MRKTFLLRSFVIAIVLTIAGFWYIKNIPNNQLESSSLYQESHGSLNEKSNSDDLSMNPGIDSSASSEAEHANYSINTDESEKIDQNNTNNTASTELISITATKDNQNALQLLQENAQVELTSYGELGDMVTGINGLQADNQHFWSIYVNNEQATRGLNDIVLMQGDTLEMRWEEIEKY